MIANYIVLNLLVGELALDKSVCPKNKCKCINSEKTDTIYYRYIFTDAFSY